MTMTIRRIAHSSALTKWHTSEAFNRHCLFHSGSTLNRFGNGNYRRFQNSSSPFSWLERWTVRPTFFNEVCILAGLCGGGFLYNLEQVPVSGRRRFNVISPRLEERIGQDMYKQILEQYKDQILPDLDFRVQLVKRVLTRLIPASGLGDRGWEIHVIESDQVNAFVIPGGKVFVFTGILPICKDEAGIAAVLGHEIAHNVAHHAAEKMSRTGLLMLGMVIIYTLTGAMADTLYRTASQIVFEMPRSRQQESEADYIGLMMMARSCYDPNASPEMFGRMHQAQKGVRMPPTFLSTHPPSDTRRLQLQEWLPQAYHLLSSSNCGSIPEKVIEFRQAIRSRSL